MNTAFLQQVRQKLIAKSTLLRFGKHLDTCFPQKSLDIDDNDWKSNRNHLQAEGRVELMIIVNTLKRLIREY
jgi:hypothetical protein